MDVRLLGDDNRETVVSIPMVSTVKNIRQIIAERLIISDKHIMDLNLEKRIIPTNDDDKEEYIDIFKSVDIDDKITLNEHLNSGDTIYINNASSLCDPNVWRVNEEWSSLIAISSTLDEEKLMEYIQLCLRICENIIEDPHNQKYRHLNYAKIRDKISNIPQGMQIFQCIGFILKPNKKDFNFYVMHSLKPLKHLLKCIYLKYPEFRPKDAKFMAQFESFDTKTNKFEIEKKEEKEKIKQIMEERKEYYQNLEPNQEVIIPPSRGTRIAHGFHVILENAILIVIIIPIVWWLFKAVFWPYFS